MKFQSSFNGFCTSLPSSLAGLNVAESGMQRNQVNLPPRMSSSAVKVETLRAPKSLSYSHLDNTCPSSLCHSYSISKCSQSFILVFLFIIFTSCDVWLLSDSLSTFFSVWTLPPFPFKKCDIFSDNDLSNFSQDLSLNVFKVFKVLLSFPNAVPWVAVATSPLYCPQILELSCSNLKKTTTKKIKKQQT